jgi:hypothetical protein
MKRYGPSRRRAQTASVALRIFVRHPKKTFSTISALFGHAAIAESRLLSGVKRKLDFEPGKRSFWRQSGRSGGVAEYPLDRLDNSILSTATANTGAISMTCLAWQA